MSVHWNPNGVRYPEHPTKDFGGPYMGDSRPPNKTTKAIRRRDARLTSRVKEWELVQKTLKTPSFRKPGSNKG